MRNCSVPGYFVSMGADCAPCPWGFYCPAGAPAAYACPHGTANPYTGAADPADCVPCAPGTYTAAAGSPACLACPVGSYCAGGAGVPQACPAHTIAAAGAASALDCACAPDYACTYTRRVTLQLALNTTLSLGELQSDTAVASAVRDGVLLALGLYGAPGVAATFLGFVGAVLQAAYYY